MVSHGADGIVVFQLQLMGRWDSTELQLIKGSSFQDKKTTKIWTVVAWNSWSAIQLQAKGKSKLHYSQIAKHSC